MPHEEENAAINAQEDEDVEEAHAHALPRWRYFS